MPEGTLLAFADHGSIESLLSADGERSRQMLEAFGAAGVDIDALGQRLQDDGADAFVASWGQLLERLEVKSGELVSAR